MNNSIIDTIVLLRQPSADEQVRRLAEFREKRLHDEQSALSGARREGEEIGIQKGIQQGIHQGIQQGIQQELDNSVRKLREMGMSEEDIQRFLSLK